jgi:hypothetical protein
MVLRWPLLTVPWMLIIIILYFFLIMSPWLAIIIITLPYTLYYRSSNWSMRERDMPAIQLYLDHFHSLYPQLVSSIVTAHRLSPRRQPPPAIDFWPTKRDHHTYWIPFIGTLRTKHYEYPHITGLFIALESAGWSRRTLLMFLRDKVEQRPGLVHPEEKEAFAMVMEKLCTHDFMSWLRDTVLSRPIRFLAKWLAVRLKEWDRDVPMGMRAIRVSLDSVDWILERGAFLLPEDIKTRDCMDSLAALRMWRRVKNGEDLQMGLENYWQIMAAR